MEKLKNKNIWCFAWKIKQKLFKAFFLNYEQTLDQKAKKSTWPVTVDQWNFYLKQARKDFHLQAQYLYFHINLKYFRSLVFSIDSIPNSFKRLKWNWTKFALIYCRNYKRLKIKPFGLEFEMSVHQICEIDPFCTDLIQKNPKIKRPFLFFLKMWQLCILTFFDICTH